MKRLHNTSVAHIAISDRPYPQDKQIMKPHGLWYGINDAWIEWCRDNMPEWVKTNTFELEVDLSRILVLETELDAMVFNERYGKEGLASVYIPECKYIDWKEIASQYAGIEIQGYTYSYFRSTCMWYNSWDCSSGCIWDLSAVKSVKKLELESV